VNDGNVRDVRIFRQVLSIIKYIYLPPTYIYSMQDIEDIYLLVTSSTIFVGLLFQEHQMTEKHHIEQNSCISLICPK
jgi:hypothetical protein